MVENRRKDTCKDCFCVEKEGVLEVVLPWIANNLSGGRICRSNWEVGGN